jgi:hypothetical protein
MNGLFRRVHAFQLNFSQVVQVSFQNVALQFQVGKLALSGNCNQSRRFEFFDVMGERGRADRMTFAHICAGNRSLLCANLFKNFVAARVGEGFSDQLQLRC